MKIAFRQYFARNVLFAFQHRHAMRGDMLMRGIDNNPAEITSAPWPAPVRRRASAL
jgi:hypothetical protein